MDSISTDNGRPNVWHFHMAIYFAIGFFLARVFLDKYIFSWLAIKLLTKGRGRLRMNKATQAKIVKCSESMWKLTYYATVEFFVLNINYPEPWFRDIKLYFDGWPNQELKSPLKIFYMCQCGFYLYSIAALLRIGSIVLALHDASDIFMEAAKVFKYSGREFFASVFFGFFALSWLILRLIFFPFWVIRASSDKIRQCLNLSEDYPRFLYYLFNTLLIMLLVFHIYWWILICAMIIKQLKNRGKVGEDIRSDSENED